MKTRLLRLLSLTLTLSVALPCVAAASPDGMSARADQKKPLPLTHSFSKGEPGEHGGPHVLTLKNTSDAALTVSATVIQSVASHNRPRTLEIGPQTIAAGGTWQIPDLAAHDKVVVTSEGHETLEVTVPPSGNGE